MKLRLPVRAVYDTNIVRAGLRSRRRSEFACLEFIARGEVVPLCTPALFLEYEEVLTRRETLSATGLSRAEIDRLLAGLAAVIEPVVIDFDWRPLLPDPDDDLLANCAINGRATCIVTSNVRHFRTMEAGFGIRVIPPGGFVRELRQSRSNDPSG